MICINKGKIKNLTVGKNYLIVRRNNGVHQGSNIPYSGVWVINDAGTEKHYSSKRFIGLDVWREMQLKEIGI